MRSYSALALNTFKVDVTPPVGDYLCGGLHDTSLGIETPIYLRGVVLASEGMRCVLAAVDYCYLAGRSHQRLLEALAAGAGVLPQQATVHSLHLHDVPLIDEEAHALVEAYCPGLCLHNEEYFTDVLARTREAVRDAVAAPAIPVGGVAFSQHAVRKFAGTRRVLDEHGRCRIRFSVCRDPDIRAQPEGRIDPMLDQIVFYNASGRPVVCMSFYASHPQVSDGRRVVSGDTAGLALELFEKTNPDVFPLYFTGCGGDVTAGKYTTPNRPRNRLVFGLRLFDAMQAAFEKARPRPLSSMAWHERTVDVPVRHIQEDEDQLIRAIRDEEYRPAKYLAATKLVRLRQHPETYPFRLARLTLNDVHMLFMPAEMCVDYQLHAKARCVGPLAVAAYGDCFLKYVATDEAFDQGGYEVDPRWTEVERGIQPILEDTIEQLLRTDCPDSKGGDG